MARLQRAAALLCAALVLSAAAVDGAGLWGSSKKDDKAAAAPKVEPAKSTAVTAQPTAIPAGDGHNLYWCARAPARRRRRCERGTGARSLTLRRPRRRYNDVTGEASDTDPLVEMNGHKSPDSDTTYWVDPVTCVCGATAARARARVCASRADAACAAAPPCGRALRRTPGPPRPPRTTRIANTTTTAYASRL